jgi:hypothetical protein
MNVCIFLLLTFLCDALPTQPSDAPIKRALQAPSPTAFATTISSSRFTIDRFNLTFALQSDEPLVSIGASDDYNDGLGSLKTTAVCFKTGSHATITSPFIPTRVDFLLYKLARQNRDGITDFRLTLFSDDGTPEHNPLAQVS